MAGKVDEIESEMEQGGAAVGILEATEICREIKVRGLGAFPWPAALMEDNPVGDEGGVGELGLELLEFSYRVDNNPMGHVIIKGALVFDDQDDLDVRASAKVDAVNDVGSKAVFGGGSHLRGKRGEGIPINGVDEILGNVGAEERAGHFRIG